MSMTRAMSPRAMAIPIDAYRSSSPRGARLVALSQRGEGPQTSRPSIRTSSRAGSPGATRAPSPNPSRMQSCSSPPRSPPLSCIATCSPAVHRTLSPVRMHSGPTTSRVHRAVSSAARCSSPVRAGSQPRLQSAAGLPFAATAGMSPRGLAPTQSLLTLTANGAVSTAGSMRAVTVARAAAPEMVKQPGMTLSERAARVMSGSGGASSVPTPAPPEPFWASAPAPPARPAKTVCRTSAVAEMDKQLDVSWRVVDRDLISTNGATRMTSYGSASVPIPGVTGSGSCSVPAPRGPTSGVRVARPPGAKEIDMADAVGHTVKRMPSRATIQGIPGKARVLGGGIEELELSEQAVFVTRRPSAPRLRQKNETSDLQGSLTSFIKQQTADLEKVVLQGCRRSPRYQAELEKAVLQGSFSSPSKKKSSAHVVEPPTVTEVTEIEKVNSFGEVVERDVISTTRRSSSVPGPFVRTPAGVVRPANNRWSDPEVLERELEGAFPETEVTDMNDVMFPKKVMERKFEPSYPATFLKEEFGNGARSDTLGQTNGRNFEPSYSAPFLKEEFGNGLRSIAESPEQWLPYRK